MTQSKGQATARTILEAAARSIAAVGIEKASITEIAKRAKVSRGLVAHHFPKKSDLFLHVIQYVANEGYIFISQNTEQVRKERGTELRAVIESNLVFFLTNPHYFKCFFLFYYFASISTKYRHINTQMTNVGIERLETALAQLTKDNDQRKRVSEQLHRDLIAAIQKYFIVTHSEPATQYWQRTSRELLENAALSVGLEKSAYLKEVVTG